MFAEPYTSTLNFLATISPKLPTTPGRTTNFFPWAEDMASVLEFVYSRSYATAMEDLVDAVKEYQDYEDEDSEDYEDEDSEDYADE